MCLPIIGLGEGGCRSADGAAQPSGCVRGGGQISANSGADCGSVADHVGSILPPGPASQSVKMMEGLAPKPGSEVTRLIFRNIRKDEGIL